jgi:hypothetical protein
VVDNFNKTKLEVLFAFTVAASNLAMYPSFEPQKNNPYFYIIDYKLTLFISKHNASIGFENTLTLAIGLKSTALTTLL